MKNELQVANNGRVTAEDLTFEVEPVGGTQFAFPDPPVDPVTTYPHSTMAWTLIPTPSWGSSESTVRIRARWRESGEERDATWTVALDGG